MYVSPLKLDIVIIIFRNLDHKTCPICREVLVSRDDAWVLSDAPNSAEISEHIASSLINIAAD